MEVDKDAFSSGQVGSKIWLCEELERTGWSSKTTHIYGGWYGMTAFLLLSRGKFKVGNIRSYDVDPQCEVIADLINQNWVYRNWIFSMGRRSLVLHFKYARSLHYEKVLLS